MKKGGEEAGERPTEKVSINKSKSEHLQAGRSPLTGHAVCPAWPAGLGETQHGEI